MTTSPGIGNPIGGTRGESQIAREPARQVPDPALVAAVQRELMDDNSLFCAPGNPTLDPVDAERIATLMAWWLGPLLLEHQIVARMVEINASSWWGYAIELIAAHNAALRRDIAHALDAYAQERERATWEAALRLLADHEDHDGTGLHGRPDGRVSERIGELEQAFRARADDLVRQCRDAYERARITTAEGRR